MVTVGGVADQLEREKKTRRQTTPKILESFIDRAPIVSIKVSIRSIDKSVDDEIPRATGRTKDYSSP
jgi:hypothetical protein